MNRTMKRLFTPAALFALLALAAAPALAQVAVRDAWVRATVPGTASCFALTDASATAPSSGIVNR